MLELTVSGQHSLPNRRTPSASTPYVGRHRSDRSAPSGRPRRERALLKSVGVDADPAIGDDALPRENSDMTDNLTDDEVGRAHRAGEAFGRQIGGVDGVQPAGSYIVWIEEEVLDGLSFLAYRRVGT